jgi:glycosyltransferase involved in cell wall biosynthesis
MFSVLMSIYANEKPEYVDACLESILGQTLLPTQIVIVEDGPITVELEDAIDKYQKSLNILRVPIKKHVGLAKALNEGFNFCSYDLIARVDADDICESHRFEKQYSFLEKRPEIAALSSGLTEYNENMTKIVKQKFLPIDHEDLIKFSKFRSPLNHPAVMFRKKAIISVGGYPEFFPEDYFLWIKLICNGFKIANLNESLIKMRVGNAVSDRRGWKFLSGELKALSYMRQHRMVNFLEYLLIFSFRLVLRLSPKFLRRFFYEILR